jgi:hypothetical protein
MSDEVDAFLLSFGKLLVLSELLENSTWQDHIKTVNEL